MLYKAARESRAKIIAERPKMLSRLNSVLAPKNSFSWINNKTKQVEMHEQVQALYYTLNFVLLLEEVHYKTFCTYSFMISLLITNLITYLTAFLKKYSYNKMKEKKRKKNKTNICFKTGVATYCFSNKKLENKKSIFLF